MPQRVHANQQQTSARKDTLSLTTIAKTSKRADKLPPPQINSKVTGTCALFANYTASLTRYLDQASSSGSMNIETVDDEKLKKLFSILQQYEQHFSRHLKILLDALNYLAATETVGFLGLCARLSMAAEGGVDGRPGPGGGVEGL
jgi:gamma-tubulin complex component 2